MERESALENTQNMAQCTHKQEARGHPHDGDHVVHSQSSNSMSVTEDFDKTESISVNMFVEN